MTKCNCGATVSNGRVQWEWLGDGHCDEAYECSTPECNFDFGDCSQCSEICPRAWQGDGVCDAECFTPECAFDKKPVITVCPERSAENFDPRGLATWNAGANQSLCTYATPACDPRSEPTAIPLGGTLDFSGLTKPDQDCRYTMQCPTDKCVTAKVKLFSIEQGYDFLHL